MNKTLAWLCAAVLTLTLVSGAHAENGKRTGKVVRIKGDARYSTGNKIWQPLKVGTVIQSGNVVQTAANSFVDIVVNEEDSAPAVSVKPMSTASSSAAGGGGGGGDVGTPDLDVIRVLDDSYLVFDSLNATATGAGVVTETLLDLKKGSIFGSVKKMAAASRFEVKIPNGVAGIRGTTFMISANGNIACFLGSVVAAFAKSAGAEVTTEVVGAGRQFNINTGENAALDAALASLLNAFAQIASAFNSVANITGAPQAFNYVSSPVSKSEPSASAPPVNNN